MVITVSVLLIVSIVGFGASAPKNPGGLALVIAFSIAAMFAIGLAIAAAARTPEPPGMRSSSASAPSASSDGSRPVMLAPGGRQQSPGAAVPAGPGYQRVAARCPAPRIAGQ